MNDVALNVSPHQVHPDRSDGALDAAADRDFLRLDTALDLCAFADHELGGAQLALDSAEDLRWTTAFDVADDRHAGADTRDGCRHRRRCVLVDRRAFPLRYRGRTCHHIFLKPLALEHFQPPAGKNTIPPTSTPLWPQSGRSTKSGTTAESCHYA